MGTFSNFYTAKTGEYLSLELFAFSCTVDNYRCQGLTLQKIVRERTSSVEIFALKLRIACSKYGTILIYWLNRRRLSADLCKWATISLEISLAGIQLLSLIHI